MDLPGTDQPISDVEGELSQKLMSAALLTAQVAEAAVFIRQ